MTETLAQFLTRVSRGYSEIALPGLFDLLNLPNNASTLSKVQLTIEELKKMGLKVVPDINYGKIDSIRRVVFADENIPTSEAVRLELAQRETDTLEFKSSLLFDHNRAKFQPDTPRINLKSEQVLYSILKTIAAFLTCAGGTLVIGVDDKTNLLGIHYDFYCMTGKPDKQNADGWELIFRSYILGRFKDGAIINDYVRCTILTIENKLIARVSVSPRKQLSFLSQQNEFFLYKRQGNRTVQVHIEQIEEFLNLRKTLFE